MPVPFWLPESLQKLLKMLKPSIFEARDFSLLYPPQPKRAEALPPPPETSRNAVGNLVRVTACCYPDQATFRENVPTRAHRPRNISLLGPCRRRGSASRVYHRPVHPISASKNLVRVRTCDVSGNPLPSCPVLSTYFQLLDRPCRYISVWYPPELVLGAFQVGRLDTSYFIYTHNKFHPLKFAPLTYLKIDSGAVFTTGYSYSLHV